jgi:Flp pilus assembly protein TadG
MNGHSNALQMIDTKPVQRTRFGQNIAGSAAVEFAIIGPAFVVVLLGIMSFGGYFWLAHSVQQLANDSARAAVAGLNATQRQQLAQSTINAEVQNYVFLSTSTVTATVNNQTTAMTVSIAYDASGTPFWALSGLIPMPSTTITRSATIKLAGY